MAQIDNIGTVHGHPMMGFLNGHLDLVPVVLNTPWEWIEYCCHNKLLNSYLGNFLRAEELCSLVDELEK